MRHSDVVTRNNATDVSYRLVDPLDPECGEQWDAMVAANPAATLFHTAAWAQVLADTYGYRPVYMVIENRDGGETMLPLMEIKSILTGTRGVSLPFTDHCEPLSMNGLGPTNLIAVVGDLARERGWKSIEFRGGADVDAVPSTSFYRHSLRLNTDTENLFAHLASSTRRNIKKASREHVETRISDTEEAMKAYYRLHCITRKRQGSLPQPYSFFRNIQKHIIAKGRGFIVLGAKDGVDIAGAVFFYFGTKALYKFGASDYSYQHLRANSLVMWKAIETLVERGQHSLCFGRTELHHEGLRRFKNAWGTDEETIHYYMYDLKQRSFITAPSDIAKPYARIFRALPIPLSRMAGALLYRHVG